MIILDESGSMCSVHRKAIESVNSTLATIRQAQERYPSQKHTVSLMTFNSEQLSLFHVNTPVGNVADMALNEYSPEGCTPLYDAVGKGVTQLRTQVEPYDVVLVTIITDGYENSSVEYTGASIHALIDKMRGEGWVFAFMGANQDVTKVSVELNIDVQNAREFEFSATGARDAFDAFKEGSMNFFCAIENCDNEVGDDVSEKDRRKRRRQMMASRSFFNLD